jgi:lysophospholipid acyltransferase (LPLAT)-like uncharacterized protein
MKFYKRISKHPLFIRTVAFMAATYIGLVYRTTRWQKLGWPNADVFWNNEKPFICAFWHNRLLMGPFGWTHHRPIHMLISGHADGQLISQTVAHQGIQTISGSSSKGGIAALKALLKVLKGGGYIGITPDGPRGPRFSISDGTVSLAKLSGCPILPLTYAIKSRIVLGTWDRFIIALPFSKGVLIWGEPLYISKEATDQELDQFKETVKTQMLALSDQADSLCGQRKLR